MWIEIFSAASRSHFFLVEAYTALWIEIGGADYITTIGLVEAYTALWIEMLLLAAIL